MTQTYKVQVSMNQAHIVESGFVWKQGDFGFNIEIEVLDFDTTGATPQIIFRKSTGAVEATQISVAGNKFTYAIRGTELDTPGPCVCDLKLNDSTTKRVSTASFKYFVIPDTMDGLAEEASSYSDTIAQIIDGYEAELAKVGNNLAQAYSTSSTYKVGDYVIYNDVLYRCQIEISTAEAWTASHWLKVSMGEVSAEINNSLNDFENDLSFRHLNQFDKTNVTLNSYLGRSATTSCFDPPISGGLGFVSNQIYRVKYNDVIHCTHPAFIVYVYDANGLYIERYTNESQYDKIITAANAYYMRWQYGSAQNIDAIMLSVNNSLPEVYTPYESVTITTEETKQAKTEINNLDVRVTALEHPETNQKTYVMISFDDPTQMYADRFPVMQEYGFPFTFAINSSFETYDGFYDATQREQFFKMLDYGCDYAQYSVSSTETAPTSTSTVQEWEDALKPLYDKFGEFGIYPSAYFARQNVLYDNAITALKNIGFSIARSGMYSPENNYRWIESFNDSRFNTPVYIINSDTLANCKQYLDDCIANGWSMAFMTHRLTGADDNNCDITTFRNLMGYIKDYVDNGQCEVVTYQQFLNAKTKKGKNVDASRKNKRLDWVHNQILSLP